MIRYVLENGGKEFINDGEKFKYLPIALAAQHNEVENIHFLIQNGADINATTKAYGKNAIFYAFSIETFRTIISYHPKQISSKKCGDIFQSIITKHKYYNPITIFFDELLNIGFDINFRSNNGFTPLMIACMKFQKVIPYLLKHGADPTLKSKDSLNSLQIGCKHNIHSKYLELMIKAGADPNYSETIGNRPIQLVKKVDRMKVLIQNGATNFKIEGLFVSYFEMKYFLDRKIVEKFVFAGGDPNFNVGFKRLIWRAIDDRAYNLVSSILSNPIVDFEGKSPLLYFLKRDVFNMQDNMFLSTIIKADPNGAKALSEKGNSAIHYLMKSTKTSEEIFLNMLGILIQSGADINHQNSNGLTPLMKGIKNKNNYIHILLEKGVDLNIVDSNGMTALHHAAKKNFGVKILLQYGANALSKDNKGRIPYEYALIFSEAKCQLKPK